MWRSVPCLLIFAAGCGMGSPRAMPMAAAAPDFSLPGIDGKTHSLAEYSSSPVLAVVFTCNHCAAAQRYEERLKALDWEYRAKGVRLVAINPDAANAIPLRDLAYTDVGDSLADMKARATARHFEFPYLYDGENQQTATRFGVETLPHIFIFDRERKLKYEGRIDDNINEASVTRRDAGAALDAVLGGRSVPVDHTTAVGCRMVRASQGSAPQEEMAKIEAEPVKLEMAAEDRLKQLRANPTSKLLMVNFWATWCGPCVTEFPELEATYRMYRQRGFDFVSVSANDPEEKPQVIDFLKKNHASGTNLQFATPDTFGLQAAFDPMMPAAVPFTVLIAPNGDILFQQLGELDFPKLRRTILANLSDDPGHPGQQAYWSSQ